MLLLLAVLSAVGAVATFSYAQNAGGWDATVIVSGHVLTGPMLYAISAVLLVAAGLFVVAAVLKALRRVLAIAAVVFLASGGAIGGISPKSVTDYEAKHACQVIAHQCDRIPALGEPKE